MKCIGIIPPGTARKVGNSSIVSHFDRLYLRSSMVELAALNREVVGSSPTGGTIRPCNSTG